MIQDKNFYLLGAEGVSIYKKSNHLYSLENCYFDIYKIVYNEEKVLKLLDTMTKELGCNTATSMKRNGLYTNVEGMQKMRKAKNKRIICCRKELTYAVEHPFIGPTKTCTRPALYQLYWNEDPLIVALYQCINERNIINLQALYNYLNRHKEIIATMTDYFQNCINCFEISSEPLKRRIYDEEYRKLTRACCTGGAYISLADCYSQRERDAEELRSLLGKLDYEFESQLDIAYKNTKVLEKLKKYRPSS